MITTTNDGGPAFPIPVELCQDLTIEQQRGMSLRDYASIRFAIELMRAGSSDEEIAECSLKVAKFSNKSLTEHLMCVSFELAGEWLKARAL